MKRTNYDIAEFIGKSLSIDTAQQQASIMGWITSITFTFSDLIHVLNNEITTTTA